MSRGFIYVLTNEYMPQLYKVGHTTRDVRTRTSELSAPTGVPGVYMELSSWEVSNSLECERVIHNLFKTVRVSGEHFRFESGEECIAEIVKLLKSLGELDENGRSYTAEERIRIGQQRYARQQAEIARQQAEIAEKKLEDARDRIRRWPQMQDEIWARARNSVDAELCFENKSFKRSLGIVLGLGLLFAGTIFGPFIALWIAFIEYKDHKAFIAGFDKEKKLQEAFQRLKSDFLGDGLELVKLASKTAISPSAQAPTAEVAKNAVHGRTAIAALPAKNTGLSANDSSKNKSNDGVFAQTVRAPIREVTKNAVHGRAAISAVPANSTGLSAHDSLTIRSTDLVDIQLGSQSIDAKIAADTAPWETRARPKFEFPRLRFCDLCKTRIDLNSRLCAKCKELRELPRSPC